MILFPILKFRSLGISKELLGIYKNYTMFSKIVPIAVGKDASFLI